MARLTTPYPERPIRNLRVPSQGCDHCSSEASIPLPTVSAPTVTRAAQDREDEVGNEQLREPEELDGP